MSVHRECGYRATRLEESLQGSRLHISPELLKAEKDARALALGKAYLKILALSVPFSVWYAYVFQHLWSWFAEPLGAPHLKLVHLMGLWVIVSLLRSKPFKDKELTEEFQKTPKKMVQDYLLNATLYPGVALFAGWIYSLLM